MRVSSVFTCKDARQNSLGYCLAHPFTRHAGAPGSLKGLPPKQYYMNTYLREVDYGSNPYNMMQHPCDKVLSTEMTENINALLSEEVVLPINIDLEGALPIYNGLLVPISAGEFYFLKVPYGTVNIDNGDINITISEAAKGDTYIFISSVNNDIQFGEGLLTTREYLINSEYVPKIEKEFILSILPPIKRSTTGEKVRLIGTGRELVRSEEEYLPGRAFKEGDIYQIPEDQVQGETIRYKCLHDTWIEDSNNFCPGIDDNFYLI